MEEWLRLSKHGTGEEVDPMHYRWLIGSLRYLVHTHPDLAFAVGFVSRFMAWPMVVTQLPKPNKDLSPGFNLAADIDTSKSTSGTLFFLGNCLVNWQSIKQKVVALLSYEAEYIVITTAATQALWLSRLLEELLSRHVEVVELKVDNKSALALAKNPVFHLADILTNSLGKAKFQEMRERIGLKQITSKAEDKAKGEK
ncbi:secreted RxLR effector protein 161-like [Miscanthus floridulus]|uniref:secreted RxLR effector protein 161-like n=1 Tax=Miscanthus floridulus TaxID=154761 RepID=UPI00345875FD